MIRSSTSTCFRPGMLIMDIRPRLMGAYQALWAFPIGNHKVSGRRGVAWSYPSNRQGPLSLWKPGGYISEIYTGNLTCVLFYCSFILHSNRSKYNWCTNCQVSLLINICALYNRQFGSLVYSFIYCLFYIYLSLKLPLHCPQ